jgi:hypothetical protein
MHLNSYTYRGSTHDTVDFGHTSGRPHYKSADFLVTHSVDIFHKDVTILERFVGESTKEDSYMFQDEDAVGFVAPIGHISYSFGYDDPLVQGLCVRIARNLEEGAIVLDLDFKLSEISKRSKFPSIGEPVLKRLVESLKLDDARLIPLRERIVATAEPLGLELDTVELLTFPKYSIDDLGARELRILTYNLDVPEWANTGLHDQDGIAKVTDRFPEDLYRSVLDGEERAERIEVSVERTILRDPQYTVCGSGRGITSKVGSYTLITVPLADTSDARVSYSQRVQKEEEEEEAAMIAQSSVQLLLPKIEENRRAVVEPFAGVVAGTATRHRGAIITSTPEGKWFDGLILEREDGSYFELSAKADSTTLWDEELVLFVDNVEYGEHKTLTMYAVEGHYSMEVYHRTGKTMPEDFGYEPEAIFRAIHLSEVTVSPREA